MSKKIPLIVLLKKLSRFYNCFKKQLCIVFFWYYFIYSTDFFLFYLHWWIKTVVHTKMFDHGFCICVRFKPLMYLNNYLKRVILYFKILYSYQNKLVHIEPKNYKNITKTHIYISILLKIFSVWVIPGLNSYYSWVITFNKNCFTN